MRRVVPTMVLATALASVNQFAGAEVVLQAGVGADPCRTWTANRRVGSWGMGEQWILGFVSGVSATGGLTNLAPLTGTGPKGVWAWIDSYCQEHPLETLDQAGMAFVYAHPN